MRHLLKFCSFYLTAFYYAVTYFEPRTETVFLTNKILGFSLVQVFHANQNVSKFKPQENVNNISLQPFML